MLIFAADPGSTSTKIAVYEDERAIFEKNLPFPDEERARYATVLAQLPARCAAIESALAGAGFGGRKFDAAVGRGGLLAPVPSGTYLVNGAMTEWLGRAPRGEHASNLGPFIAQRFAEKSGAPAYIVDPVSVDELSDVARLSGAPEIERGSLVHALNQRATARRAAAELGKKYEECRFVVAHLGTGLTIGAHAGGRIVDVSARRPTGHFPPSARAGFRQTRSSSSVSAENTRKPSCASSCSPAGASSLISARATCGRYSRARNATNVRRSS